MVSEGTLFLGWMGSLNCVRGQRKDILMKEVDCFMWRIEAGTKRHLLPLSRNHFPHPGFPGNSSYQESREPGPLSSYELSCFPRFSQSSKLHHEHALFQSYDWAAPDCLYVDDCQGPGRPSSLRECGPLCTLLLPFLSSSPHALCGVLHSRGR